MTDLLKTMHDIEQGEPLRKPGEEVRIRITIGSSESNTVFNVLAAKLGREPTSDEAAEEVKRIIREALAGLAGRGP